METQAIRLAKGPALHQTTVNRIAKPQAVVRHPMIRAQAQSQPTV